MSAKEQNSLEKVQRLVLDIMAVERNHRIPERGSPENVIEHSFSVAMLCWRIFDLVRPSLDLSKIFKYALVHDFAERGYKTDVNTFASADERNQKKEREAKELQKIAEEFADFRDFTGTLTAYEAKADGEALFVWSVDKLQAIILGGTIDGWWPYRRVQVSYDHFHQKGEEFIAQCSPNLRELFIEVMRESEKTYYDRPAA